MKIKCNREALLHACQLVGVAVAARTTKPVLSNIKAIAIDDTLTLMATDNEIGIRYELRGIEVLSPGEAILPPSKLVPILRECSGEDVTLDASSSGTLVRTATGKFNLPGGDPAEFPDIPEFTAESSHQIDAGVLRTMIRRTSFAADKTDATVRWAVTGILYEADDKGARLIATDTRRMAWCEGKTNDYATKGESLIPLKAIQILDRSCTDDGETITVSLKKNEAMFKTGRAVIHTRLVEGRFPPFRDIIPKKHAHSLTIPVAEFLSAVKQSAIMTDDETKRVEFRFETGKVTLNARGGLESGSGEVVMDLPDYAGPEIEIAFNPQYVADMLKSIDGEPTVELLLTDGNKPAVFRLGGKYTYLVMPLTS